MKLGLSSIVARLPGSLQVRCSPPANTFRPCCRAPAILQQANTSLVPGYHNAAPTSTVRKENSRDSASRPPRFLSTQPANLIQNRPTEGPLVHLEICQQAPP